MNYWVQRQIIRRAEVVSLSQFLHDDGTIKSSLIKFTEWIRSLCEVNSLSAIEFGLPVDGWYSNIGGEFFERYVQPRLSPFAEPRYNLRLPDNVICFVLDGLLKHYILVTD